MVSALVRGLMFVTVMLACTANSILNDTADEGSALVTVIDDEDGELTQLQHTRSVTNIAIALDIRHNNRQHKLTLELI